MQDHAWRKRFARSQRQDGFMLVACMQAGLMVGSVHIAQMQRTTVQKRIVEICFLWAFALSTYHAGSVKICCFKGSGQSRSRFVRALVSRGTRRTPELHLLVGIFAICADRSLWRWHCLLAEAAALLFLRQAHYVCRSRLSLGTVLTLDCHFALCNAGPWPTVKSSNG